jgi:hypothetical protein
LPTSPTPTNPVITSAIVEVYGGLIERSDAVRIAEPIENRT